MDNIIEEYTNAVRGKGIFKLPKALSLGEETMAQQLNAYNISFEREFKFNPNRNWRFDFVLSDTDYAIEIDGGTTCGKSRHSFGIGYENDCIKLNHAVLDGWKVFRFTTAMVKRGEAIDFIRSAIA